MIYDAIIVGGGPAGLMTAIELEKNKKTFLLLEKNEQVGKKLLISGSKRCNVTNNQDVETFINALTIKNKRFLYSALYTFGPEQVIDFFESNNCPLQLENNFKYFPASNKSRSILDVLVGKINPHHIKNNTSVEKITFKNGVYDIESTKENYRAHNLVIATGSKSFPSTGSNGFGLKIAKRFNINFTDFTPAETHVFSSEIVNNYRDLQGVSINNATITLIPTKKTFKGDLLFTHFGLSGPAIYHLSEFIYDHIREGNKTLSINLTDRNRHDILKELKETKEEKLKDYLKQYLTKRHTENLLKTIQLTKTKITELSNEEKVKIVDYLTNFSITVDKVEDRTKAYVNRGGIDTKELHPHSMECKNQPGLYFIGETTNLHGPIGGYNITIGFSTGKLAGIDISTK